MKKIIVLMSIMMLMCGCAQKTVETVSSQPTASFEPTVSKNESSRSEYDNLPKAFADILNDGEFIDENGEVTTLSTHIKIKPADFHPEKYAVADLDQNGTDEFIVAITDYNGYYIFNIEDAKIYGSYIGYRAFKTPKADGRFAGSSSAFTSGVYRITSFDKAARTEETLCETDDYQQVYTVESKPVSKEKAEEYFEDFEKSEDLKWTVLP